MKIKLFTHGEDLDGVSCAILTSLAYGEANVDVEYCNYPGQSNAIDEKFEEFLVTADFDEYDKILITDISISEELADSAEYAGLKDKLVLLDHHKTALGLNVYDWADVYVNEKSPKSGTLMLFEYLETHFLEKLWNEFGSEEEIDDYMCKLKAFATMVSEYDTWFWFINKNEMPKRLNDLFKILGKQKFIEKICNHIDLQGLRNIFSNSDRLLLDLEQKKIDKYIWKKEQNMRIESRWGYEVGIVFAEQYVSELGNKICENHPEIDLIAIINPDHGVSFRATKDEVDVSEIAKKYGGGGHPKAGGMSVMPAHCDAFIDLIFDREKRC